MKEEMPFVCKIDYKQAGRLVAQGLSQAVAVPILIVCLWVIKMFKSQKMLDRLNDFVSRLDLD